MAATLTGQAKCADRLDLVDAAYARPGGPAARQLKQHVCPTCPIIESCFTEGMQGEDGVWGGTSPRQRTTAGGPDRKHHKGQAA